MNKKVYRNILINIQKKCAIRIICAYWTTSVKVILVLARKPPIHLLVEERMQIENSESKTDALNNILDKWKDTWLLNDEAADWSRKLISDLRHRCNRESGEVNYFLTQILAGHCAFQAYLRRFQLSDSEQCMYCGFTDTAEHTFFECSLW